MQFTFWNAFLIWSDTKNLWQNWFDSDGGEAYIGEMHWGKVRTNIYPQALCPPRELPRTKRVKMTPPRSEDTFEPSEISRGPLGSSFGAICVIGCIPPQKMGKKRSKGSEIFEVGRIDAPKVLRVGSKTPVSGKLRNGRKNPSGRGVNPTITRVECVILACTPEKSQVWLRRVRDSRFSGFSTAYSGRQRGENNDMEKINFVWLFPLL
jgi:hypothetical protein